MTPANAKSLQHCYNARDFFDGSACCFDEPARYFFPFHNLMAKLKRPSPMVSLMKSTELK